MNGVVKLLKPGIGKIILQNGQVTPLISFPLSFEDGDNIEAIFKNNDITLPPIKLIAYSQKEYYGFIVEKFNNQSGLILVTYPHLKGTILFNNYSSTINQKVKFRLKKSQKGIEAVEIKEVTKEEHFKASLPIFGTLHQASITPKEGVVEEVVVTDKNVIEGIVKSIRTWKNYGFITSPKGEIFFNINQFKRVYYKEPTLGAKVYFSISQSPKGPKVKRFFLSPTIFLPKKEHYIIVDSKKFSFIEYEKKYEKVPEVGDVVYYIGNKLIKSSNPIKFFIFKVNRKIEDIQKGEVSFLKGGFGFITSNNQRYFFLINDFTNTYHKKPKIGAKVYFKPKTTPRGLQVSKFFNLKYLFKETKIFKNFVNIDNNSLYYAYIKDNTIQEIYRFNEKDLSHSIACYKFDTSREFKIKAIECLMENNYQTKEITYNKLKNEKLKILDQLISKYLKNNPAKAFEYELKYQEILFQPQRLKKFNFPKIEFIKKPKNIKEFSSPQEISFITKPKEIKYFKSNEKINFIKPPSIKIVNQKEKKWQFIERIRNEQLY